MNLCKLYRDGNCLCYLEKCDSIDYCAPKLIEKKNMKTVIDIINETEQL